MFSPNIKNLSVVFVSPRLGIRQKKSRYSSCVPMPRSKAKGTTLSKNSGKQERGTPQCARIGPR
jgi:hypothetical protein